MTSWSYTSKGNVYTITWTNTETGKEICSDSVTITGVENGIMAALASEAQNIRERNIDKFPVEVNEAEEINEG